MEPTKIVPRWSVFEVALKGPEEGNPFVDVQLKASFQHPQDHRTVRGFYDGEGRFVVRFMPCKVGAYRWETSSNCPALDGLTGDFDVVEPEPGHHGPVQVEGCHFRHADGTPHASFGTTCYAWVHQPDDQVEQTLQTLAGGQFNKLRMCVFPKDYRYNQNEPPLYPFEGDPLRNWDFSRPNPAFYRRLESCIGRLAEIGVQADVILFHPYDRWGFADMGPSNDDAYLRYVVSRLAAYANVWWSLANEFDFMEAKNPEDWERFFQIVKDEDPFGHLCSIHNGARWYDHSKPWVSHCSLQTAAVGQAKEYVSRYGKPVVFDEICYEGNVEEPWGNITAEEMVHRFWVATIGGAYCGHGETYTHPDDVLWWSKGGVLHGDSPPRIGYLKNLIESKGLFGLEPIKGDWRMDGRGARTPKGDVLIYFGPHQPSGWILPEGGPWVVDRIDTWEMISTRVADKAEGGSLVPMPSIPRQALCLTRA